MYQAWSAVAPDVDAFPALMDKTGDLPRRPYDWTEEIKQLSIPTLLVYGDADSVPPSHAAAFFALLGGGLKDAGGTVRCPQTCASPSSPASPTTTSSTPNSWQTSSPSSPADSGRPKERTPLSVASSDGDVGLSGKRPGHRSGASPWTSTCSRD
jgi:hypothetical protein